MSEIRPINAVQPIYKVKRLLSSNENMEEINKGAAELRNKIKKLNNSKIDDPQSSKLARNIKNFVKEYNDFKKKIDETDDKYTNKEYKKIEKLLSENKKELKKMGISVNEKGLMSFDSEKIKPKDKIDLNKLFYKYDSFTSKASKLIRNIGNNSSKNLLTEEFVKVKVNVNQNSETNSGTIIDVEI